MNVDCVFTYNACVLTICWLLNGDPEIYVPKSKTNWCDVILNKIRPKQSSLVHFFSSVHEGET